MMTHPLLINRPMVVTPRGVALCRPSEKVLDILPGSQLGAFSKEGGEPVLDAAGRRVGTGRGHERRVAGRGGAAAPGRAGHLRAVSHALGGALHRCGHRPRGACPGVFPGARKPEGGRGEHPGRGAHLADDRSDAAAGGLRRYGPSGPALARHRRHPGRKLAGQAVLHGPARLAVHRLAVPAVAAPGQIDSYIAGLILLAAAPCTAMVFVWSRLTDGEPNFTLSQVALNDAIMVVAFAPVVGLLLGLSAISVPWDTLLLSVILYIVVPLVTAQVWRRRLLASGGEAALARALRALGPVSLVALLATLVLLFGFQGQQILAQPLVILLLAVPILIQVYLNAGIAYLLNRQCGSAHSVAGPSALIGASNFFELAVAAAISLFGFESGAALATVVGVLVEVPVMLSVVRIVMATRGWYERGAHPAG